MEQVSRYSSWTVDTVLQRGLLLRSNLWFNLNLIMRGKKSDKSKMGEILKNNWPVL